MEEFLAAIENNQLKGLFLESISVAELELEGQGKRMNVI